MESIKVDGESVSPEDITKEAGRLTSRGRSSARALPQLGLTPGHSHGQEGAGSRPTNRQSRAKKQTSRQPRLLHQPPLPKGDIKTVLRPREGLNITKISHAGLCDGVLRATGLSYDKAAKDLFRINPAKNIIVASTPSMEHVSKYSTVKGLRFGEKSYNVTADAAPPKDTVKWIIHNIPEYDSAEDITRSLVYEKNTMILQARRMGRTNRAIIVFEGTTVPCGRHGHRTDVCPPPDKNICKICGTEALPENHQCKPKCALCGQDHPTGDKKCRLRFQTPYFFKKRKWEKQQKRKNNRRRLQNGSSNRASTSSMLKKDGPSENPRPASAVDRAPSHASRSGQLRQQSTPLTLVIAAPEPQHPRPPGPETQVEIPISKRKTANRKIIKPTSSEQSDQQSEITKIRQMLELVNSENTKLKAELAQLKGTSADSTPSPSPAT
ncbi:hypothetical protein HPB47_006604 [Ixodes persulcatus]|uniref:Uncharacterized protein n=1 Tax=Ixodes persulcatus TaxID=34615 RepID=A0AC60PAC2_IXOPE|nr:hypothetical protein HPB47_006604 [Ixodes persulcatus]